MKKKKVSKTKVPTRKVWKVLINWVSGQSFYKDKIFEGKYYIHNFEEMSKSISQMIKQNLDFEETLFIGCKDEELKLQLLSEIIKQEPKLKIKTKPNQSGSSWGTNVFIDLIDEEYTEEEAINGE